MRALPLLLASFASPLVAECPTGADMQNGVVLTDINGETETFKTGPNGFVRGIYDDGQGYGARYLLMGGVYVVEVFDTEDGDVVPGTRSTFVYPVKPSEITPPVPGGRWDVKTLVNDQGDIHPGSESHIFGPTTEVTIGACSYNMIPIISIYHAMDGYEERLNYLPEFGFAYLVEIKDPGEAPFTYEFVSITAAR